MWQIWTMMDGMVLVGLGSLMLALVASLAQCAVRLK